jgi:sulfur relay protein TusB/DsrH
MKNSFSSFRPWMRTVATRTGDYFARQTTDLIVLMANRRAKTWDPARPAEDIGRLPGVKVFAVREDLEARGINSESCIDGVQMIPGRDIAGLLEDYEQVWHW